MKQRSNRAAYEKRKSQRTQEPSLSNKEERNSVPIIEEKTEIRQRQRKSSSVKQKNASVFRRKKVLWIGGVAAVAVIVVIIVIALLGGGGTVGHGVFFVNSDTAVADGETKTLTQRLYANGDVTMAPAEDFCEVMDMKLQWDENDGTFSVKGPEGKVEGTVGDRNVSLDGEEIAWSTEAVATDGVLYLPVADLCDAVGYTVEYTASVQRLDIFLPNENNHAPEVDFSADKETYQVGETVIFTIDASDRDGDDIVDYEWENRQERYDSPGEVTVTLCVKDSRGAWSEQVSHSINITDSGDGNGEDSES